MTDDPVVEVIHIAFRDYGPAVLERFLASYDRWPAGCPHVLTIALKGYRDGGERDLAAERCRRSGAGVIDVPDEGLDIGTYFHAAALTRADILCLMNSNAEILGEGWLGGLVGALRDQGGGAVSATGSFESLASDQLRAASDPAASLPRRLVRLCRLARHFPAFPNVHLRTNALVIGRQELLRMKTLPRSKEEAWRFESGRSGLSADLRRRGLPIRIVGRDGRAFAPSQWASSGIFWQGGQADLLIADNQTRRYAEGDDDIRTTLQGIAWSRPRIR